MEIAFNRNGDLFVVDGGGMTHRTIPDTGTIYTLNRVPRIRPSPPFSARVFREPKPSPSIRRETSGLLTD